MEKVEIANEIQKILKKMAPEVDLEKVDTMKPLRGQFEIDSMDFANFLVKIHEKYGIEIPQSDYSKLITIDDAATYIQKMILKRGNQH